MKRSKTPFCGAAGECLACGADQGVGCRARLFESPPFLPLRDEPWRLMMDGLAEFAKRYDGMEASHLRHLLAVRDRQAVMSRQFWVRAARKALDGDVRELRNRVDLAESEPLDIVLSALATPSPPSPAEK